MGNEIKMEAQRWAESDVAALTSKDLRRFIENM